MRLRPLAVPVFLAASFANASTIWLGNPDHSHGNPQYGAAVGTAWHAGWVTQSSPRMLSTHQTAPSQFSNGSFRATFILRVDNQNTSTDPELGYVEVTNGGATVARRIFLRSEFTTGTARAIELTFTTQGQNNLTVSVYHSGNSDLTHVSTTIDLISDLNDSATWVAGATAMSHQVGNAGPPGSSTWQATAGNSGFLTYGPYTSQFAAGVYRAIFSLTLDDTTSNNQLVAVVDVNQASSPNRTLATREVRRLEFSAAYTEKTFEVPFSYSGSGPLEFRVYVTGTSFVRHVRTTVLHIGSTSDTQRLSWQGNDPALRHSFNAFLTLGGGGYSESSTWPAYADWLTYGPYTWSVPVGNSTATFSLAVDNNSADNLKVARLEVYDPNSQTVVAYREIWRKNFLAPNSAQEFDVPFEISQPTLLEFRVRTYRVCLLTHVSTKITPDRLSLTSLWDSSAHFEYRKRDTFPYGELNSSSVVVLDGVWYVFNRDWAGGLKVVVRKSLDQGRTWSDKVPILVSPVAGLNVIDGSAFYDSDTDNWHYLAQCQASRDDPWKLCHYKRAGLSPMGDFASETPNPVVNGGTLWGPICTGPGKHCPATTVDEGTPQIISKIGDRFIVAFHGANYGTVVTGYRGIAMTADFVTWQWYGSPPGVTGWSLPFDAMLSASDAASWGPWGATGSIGIGNASIIRSDGFNYALAESGDVSLLCTPYQRWVLGLLRNPTYGVTSSWARQSAAYIVNQNQSPHGCGLQYASLVRDRGDLFLVMGVDSPFFDFFNSIPNYTYQLVAGGGSPQLSVK